MNNGYHKLYDYEITPPAGAWENIANELNEIDRFKTVSQKLNGIEATPPAFAWQNISSLLNDEASYEAIGKKLYHIEVTPPAAGWHRIEESLIGTGSEAKVIPIKSTNRSVMKYATAACVIGLLGFFGYRMVERSSKTSLDIVVQIENNKSSSRKQALADNLKSLGAGQKAGLVKAGVADSVHKALASNTKNDDNLSTKNNYSTTIEKNKDINGRYIMLMTEEGDVVRMSKKLEDIADCMSGESANNTCDDQIAHWQKQLASTAMPTSPDNFLDLLELANKETDL